jgi:hypothetical protein
MSTRAYRKNHFQYDSDCRIERRPGYRFLMVISPVLAAEQPYYLGESRGGHGKVPKGNGSFRPCYLKKSAQWCRKWSMAVRTVLTKRGFLGDCL